eukprot:TRINITY_DN326_c0_g1_i1.p1 TRINITY_DN326_c0_g1~~TRINITY_DN326_c0_g1_i1.p1  ORF type:complete len:184 (-),score=17.20 TRINITY_DN326_c0_g1_i1:19-501(-)
MGDQTDNTSTVWTAQGSAGLVATSVLAGAAFTGLCVSPTDSVPLLHFERFQIAMFICICVVLSSLMLLLLPMLMAPFAPPEGNWKRWPLVIVGNFGWLLLPIGIAFFLWGLSELVLFNPKTYIAHHHSMLGILVIPGFLATVAIVITTIYYIYFKILKRE